MYAACVAPGIIYKFSYTASAPVGCPQDPKENSFPAQKGTHAANLMLASSNRSEASSVGGPSWRGTPTPLGVFVWPSQPERRVSPRQVCGTAEPRSRGACVRPPLDYVCSQPARAPATNMRDSPPRLRASNGTTYAQPPRGAPSHHSHSLQRGAAPELERAREGSQISSSTQ